MRLSLDITQEQHHRLKVVAALNGQTMKDYVLTRVFSETSAQEDDEALRQLEAFLAPRLEEARQGKFVDKSVMQIAEETIKKIKERHKCGLIILPLRQHKTLSTSLATPWKNGAKSKPCTMPNC